MILPNRLFYVAVRDGRACRVPRPIALQRVPPFPGPRAAGGGRPERARLASTSRPSKQATRRVRARRRSALVRGAASRSTRGFGACARGTGGRGGGRRLATGAFRRFSIDDTLVYWNFFLDFGPLNLGQLYRFCTMLNGKLQSPELRDKVIYYYSSSHPHARANAAFLMGAWQILYLGRSPEEAWKPLDDYGPDYPSFHDASPCACTYDVNVLHCLKGLHKARHFNFFNFDTFDLAEYEHFEAVENGDLNWIVEGKFFAFAGPHDRNRSSNLDGYQTLSAEDYIPYFQRKNVGLIVRLNKPYYNKNKFIQMGADHIDLYYLDGSNPPMRILKKFLAVAEQAAGAIGVHCKAGLGRTGTCIGCYCMKHYKFTAAEIIGWMRICRPGSVIGPQQHFMQEMEQTLWQEGDLYRMHKGAPNTGPRPPSRDIDHKTDADADAKRRFAEGRTLPTDCLSGSMGSLALAGSRSLDSSNGRASVKEQTQGDLLRTRRQQQNAPSSRRAPARRATARTPPRRRPARPRRLY